MGFRPKIRLGMLCIKCGHSKAKKGKQSPLKGRKTGKPAWNSKNLSKEHKILRNRLSRRLRHAMRRRNLTKSNLHVFNVLGFTVEQLKTHIETRFQPGMTWDNYGEWHVDHIVPDSWFQYDSMDSELFKKSWALSNLQPMWRIENISKNNRYAGGFICQPQ